MEQADVVDWCVINWWWILARFAVVIGIVNNRLRVLGMEGKATCR
jgi:hypothetical protein